jgi:L-erythro-3,5-diaminohexanoate dehydrogenase
VSADPGPWYADADLLGVRRSLEPRGALPHIARRLDAATPANAFEAEVDVEVLNVDATSYREIRERCDGDPARMAATIEDVVRERGKLQNPWTGSGGILAGRVARVGERHWDGDLRVGQRVVPLASLIAIPLRLDTVGPLSPASPQVPVTGRAIVTGHMACEPVPDDLPFGVVLSALDVYPAASHARNLAAPGAHVLVLGAGHAGLLAAAAAHEAVGTEGRVTAVDASPHALARMAAANPATTALLGDATDPVGTVAQLRRHGLPRADLTLVCTSAPGCEGTAILATDDAGAILFFSTATSFPAAALGADSVSSRTRLVIPNGYTDDRGGYALDLLRRSAPLRSAVAGEAATTTETAA